MRTVCEQTVSNQIQGGGESVGLRKLLATGWVTRTSSLASAQVGEPPPPGTTVAHANMQEHRRLPTCPGSETAQPDPPQLLCSPRWSLSRVATAILASAGFRASAMARIR